MPSDDEIERMGEWAKAFTSRGVYARSNKQKSFVELMTTLDFAQSALADYGMHLLEIECRQPPEPDIRCVCNGAHRSIELAELMDNELASRRVALNEWASCSEPLFSASQWTSEKFHHALRRLINKKGKQHSFVDILLIHTAEPWLDPSACANWVVPSVELPESIGSAFLLFGDYAFRGRHAPLLRIG